MVQKNLSSLNILEVTVIFVRIPIMFGSPGIYIYIYISQRSS